MVMIIVTVAFSVSIIIFVVLVIAIFMDDDNSVIVIAFVGALRHCRTDCCFPDRNPKVRLQTTRTQQQYY